MSNPKIEADRGHGTRGGQFGFSREVADITTSESRAEALTTETSVGYDPILEVGHPGTVGKLCFPDSDWATHHFTQDVAAGNRDGVTIGGRRTVVVNPLDESNSPEDYKAFSNRMFGQLPDGSFGNPEYERLHFAQSAPTAEHIHALTSGFRSYGLNSGHIANTLEDIARINTGGQSGLPHVDAFGTADITAIHIGRSTKPTVWIESDNLTAAQKALDLLVEAGCEDHLIAKEDDCWLTTAHWDA